MEMIVELAAVKSADATDIIRKTKKKKAMLKYVKITGK